MSRLQNRISSRAIARPAAKKALTRIRAELQTIIDCCPDLGYDMDNDMLDAEESVAEALEKIKWFPYKIWAGDLYECPNCNSQIITGVGQQRIAEHYEEDFAKVMVTLNANQFLLKDC